MIDIFKPIRPLSLTLGVFIRYFVSCVVLFVPMYSCVNVEGGHGRDRMVVGFIQLPVQSVPFTTKAVSLNPGRGEVNSIQHYMVMFVSDLSSVFSVYSNFLHQ
jgi:hypothetical protein